MNNYPLWVIVDSNMTSFIGYIQKKCTCQQCHDKIPEIFFFAHVHWQTNYGHHS